MILFAVETQKLFVSTEVRGHMHLSGAGSRQLKIAAENVDTHHPLWVWKVRENHHIVIAKNKSMMHRIVERCI